MLDVWICNARRYSWAITIVCIAPKSEWIIESDLKRSEYKILKLSKYDVKSRKSCWKLKRSRTAFFQNIDRLLLKCSVSKNIFILIEEVWNFGGMLRE